MARKYQRRVATVMGPLVIELHDIATYGDRQIRPVIVVGDEHWLTPAQGRRLRDALDAVLAQIRPPRTPTAQGMEARRVETAQQAPCEARQPDPEGDAPPPFKDPLDAAGDP